MALEIGIIEMEVYGDSKLIMNQLLNIYEVKKDDLVLFFWHVSHLLKDFDNVNLNHIPRKENRMTDALANLATTLSLSAGETTNISMCNRWCCLSGEEILEDMIEAHLGVCGAHQSATNYFSKWAEAILLKKVKKEIVVDFIRVNIIFRYGVPRYIITDNGRPFYNKSMDKLCEQFGFKQHNSSMYNVAANGLAEAFNKTLCNLLKNVVSKSKRDCSHDDEKVRPRLFQIGELVLAMRQPIALTQRMGNKFMSKWDNPYVVKEIYTNGAYKLVDKGGLWIGTINGKFLKRYYL
ncbi:UNVERIFIED_CONTAM: hypothetical protein Scaly_1505400 [Sesamum calycinum]|uniref:Integrase catalytic domain-containing protein n=1 Tax=Sesamum calycinum TaxID=2727403 RepID=A0AAW2PSU8_9LAMI